VTGLARKSLLALSGDVGNALLGLTATYFVAHELGAEILGTLGYFLGFLGTLAFVSDLGLHRAFLKQAAEDPRETGAYVSAFLLLKVILTLALLGASVVAPLLDSRLGLTLASPEAWSAYWFIVAFYVANSLLVVPVFMFRARREIARVTVISLGGHVVSSLAKIIVALGHLGMTWLAAAYALQTVAGIVLSGAFVWHMALGRPARRHVTRLLEYSAPVLVVTSLIYLTQNVDRVLLERWAGARDVGYYAAVAGVLVLLQRLPLAAITLFFPQAAEDARRGDWGELRRRLRVVERYALLMTVPLAAAVIGLSDLIVAVYLGPEFAPSASVLAVLAINPVLMALFEPYNTIVYAVDRHSRLAGVTLLGLATMVAVDLALIPTELGGVRLAGLGALGAALGALAAQAVSGACQVAIAARAIDVAPNWRGGRQLVAGASMAATILLLRSVLPDGVLSAAAALTAGAALYCGSLLLLREVGTEDFRRAGDLLNPAKMAEYIKTELRQ
jgi:O-antigen/teichoic acid export membrane protein